MSPYNKKINQNLKACDCLYLFFFQMKTDHSDAVINLLKIFFDHFFYPIEARKFEIFDLKCGYYK